MNTIQSPKEPSQILFVLGAARSGTTYIADLIDELFDYGMGPEGHFVLEIFKQLSHYGPLTSEASRRTLFEHFRKASTLRIIREEWPVEQRFDVTVDELEDTIRNHSYPGAVYAVFECIAKHLNKSYVGTKNPSYTTQLPVLEGFYGEQARYINVIRDGRDVALSTIPIVWGQNTVYACAKSWAKHIELAEEFSAVVGPKRFLNLTYESLLTNPAAELNRLEEFLGRSVEDSKRNAFLQKAQNSGFSSNFYKWRSKMSERDQQFFEAVAGRQLMRHGYETHYQDQDISLAARAYFELEEFTRKLKQTLSS